MNIAEQIQQYAESLLARNKNNAELEIDCHQLTLSILEKGDVALHDAKTIVQDILITERRKLKAAKQQAGILPKYPKRKDCNGCNRNLPASSFKKLTDHKSGMTFLRSKCTPCDNKRKRERYAKNPREKELARERYLRYIAKKQAV